MSITFEVSHKYVAMLLEDMIIPVLPAMAASTFKVEIEHSIEYLAEKIAAHWKEPRRPILKDSYVVYFYAPSTPWEFFKQEYAPEWFKKRYPVKTKSHKRTVRFTRYATYPMADIKMPDNMGQVVIEDYVFAEGKL